MNLVLELILKMIYLQHNLTFKDNLLIKLTEFLMSADFVVFLKETLTKELTSSTQASLGKTQK